MVGIFVRTMRTSAKLFNGQLSPYEVITGVKQRPPLDAAPAMTAAPDNVTQEQYVLELAKYLKQVHKHVDEQHELVRQKAERANIHETGVGASLAVCDYCLVSRPATQ